MIPATVMTLGDWDRDIRSHAAEREAMHEWFDACGVDVDQVRSVTLTEGAIAFRVDNGAFWPPSRCARPWSAVVGRQMSELEVVVPNAPLPPHWHTRRHPIAEEPA